ncbi:MAG: response regulator [Planctomycetaceae bacterium]
MSPTILIADDDRESAMLCENYLHRCGYRVLLASGGVECLTILRQEAPAVIVASVNMPWGGADGLLDCLSEESNSLPGPNVILTGHTASENVTALREMPGVFRYLRKPFLMGRLLDDVRAIELGLRDASRPNWSLRIRQTPVACH